MVTILTLLPVDITGSQVKHSMPTVLDTLHSSIIGLRCIFLLIYICIRIVAILTRLPTDISSSQVKPHHVCYWMLSPAGGGDGIALLTFVTFILAIHPAHWHPEMPFMIHAIEVYPDCCVRASHPRLLKRHLGGQIVEQNGIVDTLCIHAEDDGKCWFLGLLDLKLDF